MNGLFYFLGVVFLIILVSIFAIFENKKRKEYEMREDMKTLALLDIAVALNEVDE